MDRAILLGFLLLGEEEDAINDIAILREVRRRRRVRMMQKRGRAWAREWILDRPLLGYYHQLIPALRRNDVGGFQNFMRIPPEMFDELMARVGPRLVKQDTNWREALDPGLKLSITLRFLSSGDSYHSLMYGFRVPLNTISLIVRDTCRAIVEEYAEEVIECSVTPDAWKKIADRFGSRWNFHNCMGALDGKHVAMKCPPRGGSKYYNYKHFNSIVLLALVDADYNFIWVDVGTNGPAGDAQIFNESELLETMESGDIGRPKPRRLPGGNTEVPYFIVGDDAFAIKTWLMKPYSQRQLTREMRIFNYRLSRARRIVENAFGIWPTDGRFC